MPRKQRVRVEEDEEDDELPSDLVPSRKIARKLRKQRLKDEDEDEDDELPSGLLPSSRIARKPRKQMARGRRATRLHSEGCFNPGLKFARLRGCAGHCRRRAARL